MKRIVLVVLGVLALGGCVTGPIGTHHLDTRAKLFTPPTAEHSRIYVYRTFFFFGGAVLPTVTVDGDTETSVDIGAYTFAAFDVPPGAHVVHLRVTGGSFAYPVVTSPGGSVYYKIRVGLGLHETQTEKARAEIRKCALAWSPSMGPGGLEQ